MRTGFLKFDLDFFLMQTFTQISLHTDTHVHTQLHTLPRTSVHTNICTWMYISVYTHAPPPHLCPKDSRLQAGPTKEKAFAVNQSTFKQPLFLQTRAKTVLEKSVNNATLTFNPIFPALTYTLY